MRLDLSFKSNGCSCVVVVVEAMFMGLHEILGQELLVTDQYSADC